MYGINPLWNITAIITFCISPIFSWLAQLVWLNICWFICFWVDVFLAKVLYGKVVTDILILNMLVFCCFFKLYKVILIHSKSACSLNMELLLMQICGLLHVTFFFCFILCISVELRGQTASPLRSRISNWLLCSCLYQFKKQWS